MIPHLYGLFTSPLVRPSAQTGVHYYVNTSFSNLALGLQQAVIASTTNSRKHPHF